MMRTLNTLFILFTLLLLLSFSTLAQEEELTEEAPIEAVIEDATPIVIEDDISPVVSEQLETLGYSLFKLLWNMAYLPFAAPMVTVLTALSKRLPLKLSSPTWVFIWTIILWIAYLAATQIGYANQFESAITSFATLGAVLLGITFTPALAGNLYSFANDKNVAVIGYSRPALASVNGATPPEKIVVSELPRD
jgi:hypothetical protein